jgi:hypothetical protein
MAGCYYYYIQQVVVDYLFKYHQIPLFIRGFYDFLYEKYHTVGTKTKSKINKEKHQDFLDRELLLTRKLLKQGFLLVKLKSSLRKFYRRHHDLVDRYGISV